MKIATWNVNSIRARLPRLLDFLAREAPDALCLQETKVVDALFPVEALAAAGYQAAFVGQKSYNGVAILARTPLSDVTLHLPDDAADAQARCIAATVRGVRIVSVYVPNGTEMHTERSAYKLAWLSRLTAHVAPACGAAMPLAVAGDFNVAPRESDVWDVPRWSTSVLFHPEMRAALAAFAASGLEDVFARYHPDGGLYSWWDYRSAGFPKNRGLRIDMVYANAALAARCTGARIDRDERRGLQPSDHAPVIAEFA